MNVSATATEAPVRTRVLLVAEAANPEWVSVPLVGWSLATALARRTEAHIVTQLRNRDAFVRAGLVENVDFTAIDTERLARPAWNLAERLGGDKGLGWTLKTAISSLTYPLFERMIWQRFGADIAARRFDVVHRITPLSPTAPSSLARRCADAGVPFVLGPLNGGVPWPKGFDAERRKEREWLSYVRSAYKLLPGYRSTRQHAAALIMGSRFTLGDAPRGVQSKCVYLPENAVDPKRFSQVAEHYVGGTMRACFVGRLVPYKGPDMALEAMLPLLRSREMQLDLVGDGPLMASLREQVEREGVAAAVTFHGWVRHEQVQEVLKRSHLLVFPSVREFGGGVVLEAMALGVVPVVIDYAGPGELVDAATGYKVALGTRPQIVERLRALLDSILKHPNELAPRAAAARGQVMSRYTWDAKAAQVLEVYDWVLGRRERRPTPFGADASDVEQTGHGMTGTPGAATPIASTSDLPIPPPSLSSTASRMPFPQ